jgi:1-deoxy-D-xylulose-5-phosphate synthase
VEFAAGLSTQGIRPVAAIYSTFLQRAYDQIIHDVGLQSLPVIFCMDRAGLAGEDGQTHHGLYDIVYFRQLPGFVVAAPKDGNELRDLLWTAIHHTEGPFAIRYPKDQAIAFTPGQAPALIPIGQWEILEKGTGDTIFLAYGAMVQHAREAAAKLMAAGAAPITVVNARYCKPLDEAMLGQLLPKARLVATFEEGQLQGGFGGAILEWAAAHLDNGPKFINLGVPDRYIEHATRKQQFAELKLDADGLAATLSPFLHLRSAAAS